MAEVVGGVVDEVMTGDVAPGAADTDAAPTAGGRKSGLIRGNPCSPGNKEVGYAMVSHTGGIVTILRGTTSHDKLNDPVNVYVSIL